MHMISGRVDEGKTEGSVGVSGSAATLRKFSHIQTDDMRRMRNFSQMSSTAEIELLLLNNPAEIPAHLFPFPPTWTPSM